MVQTVNYQHKFNTRELINFEGDRFHTGRWPDPPNMDWMDINIDAMNAFSSMSDSAGNIE